MTAAMVGGAAPAADGSTRESRLPARALDSLQALGLQADDFALFGLPRRFAIDRAALDARRRELLAAAHPDRSVAQGAAAQRVAMQWATRINQAWKTLGDPVLRAAALLALSGRPVDLQRSGHAAPPELLVQQMAWHEALDDALDARDESAWAALGREVAAARSGRLERLAQALDADAPDPAAAEAALMALPFLDRIAGDLARRGEAAGFGVAGR